MPMFKRSALGLFLVACATLMLPVFTGTANAAPGALIRNYQSGKCLDADANGLNNNGDRIQLWDCGSLVHPANQTWEMFNVYGSTTDWVFRNLADGKVLDADAHSVNNNGGKVQL